MSSAMHTFNSQVVKEIEKLTILVETNCDQSLLYKFI